MNLPVLQVIIGSTRAGRAGPAVAEWFTGVAVGQGGFDVEVLDLAEVGLPMLDEPQSPAMGFPYAHEHTRAWSALISRGDAYVFVIPEYNNSYNAATKNAVDYLYREWADKAVGIVSYGGNVGAGTRGAQAFKQVLLAVRAMPVHEAVCIPYVQSGLDDDGRFTPSAAIGPAAVRMLDEMARRETALHHLRPRRETSETKRSVTNPEEDGATMSSLTETSATDSWSLLTAQVDGRDVAAVRRADGTLCLPEALRPYPGLLAALADWETLEPRLRDLNVDTAPDLLAEVSGSPIRFPPKLIGMGPNYYDHVAEMGAPPPAPTATPFFYFIPPSTTMIGSGQTVLIPADPDAKPDYEAELAVVIGRGGRDIHPDDVLEHLAGYACFNDVTVRGWMRQAEPMAEPFAWDWAACKGQDTFAPMGPVTPAWMVPDPNALSIRCSVNGIVKQDSSTKEFIRDVQATVAAASRMWTLEPGDVISTGTPGGVGHAKGEYLNDGDELRVEISGLVPLVNPVRVRVPARVPAGVGS